MKIVKNALHSFLEPSNAIYLGAGLGTVPFFIPLQAFIFIHRITLIFFLTDSDMTTNLVKKYSAVLKAMCVPELLKNSPANVL